MTGVQTCALPIFEDVEDDDAPQKLSAQNPATSLDPPTATEATTRNMEQKKKVSALIDSFTFFLHHASSRE